MNFANNPNKQELDLHLEPPESNAACSYTDVSLVRLMDF